MLCHSRTQFDTTCLPNSFNVIKEDCCNYNLASRLGCEISKPKSPPSLAVSIAELKGKVLVPSFISSNCDVVF